MPSVLQSATNQPDWCSTCVHLGEKVFVNWLAIAIFPFEQIILASFFSNIFINIFKIIFCNFFEVLSHYTSRRHSKIWFYTSLLGKIRLVKCHKVCWTLGMQHLSLYTTCLYSLKSLSQLYFFIIRQLYYSRVFYQIFFGKYLVYF